MVPDAREALKSAGAAIARTKNRVDVQGTTACQTIVPRSSNTPRTVDSGRNSRTEAKGGSQRSRLNARRLCQACARTVKVQTRVFARYWRLNGGRKTPWMIE